MFVKLINSTGNIQVSKTNIATLILQSHTWTWLKVYATVVQSTMSHRLSIMLPFTKCTQAPTILRKKPFENIDGKRGECWNCLFLYCYVPTQLFLALYMCVFIFGFPCGYF